MVSIKALLLVSLLSRFSVAEYTLSEDLTGQNFWKGFDFFTGPDPTNGHVKFLDQKTANSLSLIGSITEDGPLMSRQYIGVDMKSLAPNGRQHKFGLWIADIWHVPTGLGVWPAYWLLGTSSPWPLAGELDIGEMVNNGTRNKMTLHTNSGVAISNDTSKIANGSHIVSTNCDVNAPGQDKNAGCAVDQPAGTWGKPFNDNHGGAFVVEYSAKGIFVWFFPRDKTTSHGIDFNAPSSTSNWPKPNFVLNGDGIDLEAHFCELQIILDTTFCGEWAGKIWASSGYTSLAPTCEEYVSNHPEAFKDAFWALDGIKFFGWQNTTTTSSQMNTTAATPQTNTTAGYSRPRLSNQTVRHW